MNYFILPYHGGNVCTPPGPVEL